MPVKVIDLGGEGAHAGLGGRAVEDARGAECKPGGEAARTDAPGEPAMSADGCEGGLAGKTGSGKRLT